MKPIPHSLLLIGLTALLVACDHRGLADSSPTSQPPWQKGDSATYFVWTSDSVFINEQFEKAKPRTKLVRITLLGSNPTDSIEWREYFDMSESGTEAKWIPSTRLLYSINSAGEVFRWLNYEEIRAMADSVANITLQGLPADTVAIIKSLTLDSMNLANRLFTHPCLLHAYHFSSSGHETSTTADWRYSRWDRPDLQRTELGGCNAPGLVGMTGELMVDSTGLRASSGNAIVDRLRHSVGFLPTSLSVKMECCLDTNMGWPTYVTHTMKSEQSDLSLIRTTYITKDVR
jgi:hypothetical protein